MISQALFDNLFIRIFIEFIVYYIFFIVYLFILYIKNLKFLYENMVKIRAFLAKNHDFSLLITNS